jgi:hypothetical protein
MNGIFPLIKIVSQLFVCGLDFKKLYVKIKLTNSGHFWIKIWELRLIPDIYKKKPKLKVFKISAFLLLKE